MVLSNAFTAAFCAFALVPDQTPQEGDEKGGGHGGATKVGRTIVAEGGEEGLQASDHTLCPTTRHKSVLLEECVSMLALLDYLRDPHFDALVIHQMDEEVT